MIPNRICKFMFIVGISVGFLAQGAHADPTTPSQTGTYIAKSTFIHLADASSYILQPKGQAYLPAGTRFLAFNKTQGYLGSKRRLILTERGLWGYIRDDDRLFWNPTRYDIFKKYPNIVIIQRRHPISAPISENVTLNISFTPSEIYPMLTQDEESFVVRIDQRKIPALQSNVSYEVKISRDVATMIETEKIDLKLSDVDYFKRHLIDGVVGVQKPCGSQQISTVHTGAGGGIDLEAWFLKLKANGEFERTQIEEMGAYFNVTRWYYTRSLSGGIYRVTKKLDCRSSLLSYSYLNPSNSEIEFALNQTSQKEFPFNQNNGRIIVSCAKQVFDLSDYLVSYNFNIDEIPFILSRLVWFKNTADANECVN